MSKHDKGIITNEWIVFYYDLPVTLRTALHENVNDRGKTLDLYSKPVETFFNEFYDEELNQIPDRNDIVIQIYKQTNLHPIKRMTSLCIMNKHSFYIVKDEFYKLLIEQISTPSIRELPNTITIIYKVLPDTWRGFNLKNQVVVIEEVSNNTSKNTTKGVVQRVIEKICVLWGITVRTCLIFKQNLKKRWK